MRVKVFGGLYSGRMLDVPDESQAGDYITLPADLPAGRMFQSGRTHPELHADERSYRLRASVRNPGQVYLSCVANPPRFIRSVTVPPAIAMGITISL